MTTSGTATTELNLNELAEEAYERCGKELRTGYDLRTARRSLNLLLMEWANRGLNLWTLEQGTISLVDGTAEYNLPVDTVDVLEHVVRTGTGTNQSDLTITRISASTYASIPTKNIEGRPIQVWVDRQGTTPQITVWPVPDQSSYYTFVYWRLRRMQDAGNGVNTQDIPFRFVPALVAGLAYHLSWKIPEAANKIPLLKQAYDETWAMAAEEDREKADLRIVPRLQ